MPIYPGRRPQTYRVTVYAHGKQHEWILEGTRRDASTFEAEQRLALRAQPLSRSRAVPLFSTFSEERYAPHARAHLGADTWNKVRRYQVDTLVRLLGPRRVDELSAELIDAYKRTRLAETHRGKAVKASSVNNELRVLRTMLRWGRAEAGVPIPELRFKMLPGAGRGRVRAWTSAEVARLFAAAREVAPAFLPMLVFLLNTGCRKGEARAAQWSWVDWPARLLRIPVTDAWRPKDREAREVPLSDALVATLRSLPPSTPWLFPNRQGEGYRTFPEESFRAVRAKAKVTGGPHTTRHTFASHFLRARPDLPLLAQVLGHSTTRVTELYAHMLPGHLDLARNVVDMAPPARPKGSVAKAAPRKLWRDTGRTARK